MFSWFDQKKQISELRQELDTMKRTVNTLEIEWSEMHDRIRRMLAKISRRQQREDEREDTQPVAGENGATPRVETPSSLTPRQRIIQAQLLAHRKMQTKEGGE
jgi:chromosome segregation ATPase